MTTGGERHRSLKTHLLMKRRHIVERQATLGLRIDFVVEDSLQGQAALIADHARGKGAVIDQSHEIGTRNIQKIGGLLCCDLSLKRDQSDGIASPNLLENLKEKIGRALRQVQAVCSSTRRRTACSS